MYGPWKIKVYKTEAINRIDVVEIEFYLFVQLSTSPQSNFLKKYLKTFFHLPLKKLKIPWKYQPQKWKWYAW